MLGAALEGTTRVLSRVLWTQRACLSVSLTVRQIEGQSSIVEAPCSSILLCFAIHLACRGAVIGGKAIHMSSFLQVA